MADKVLVTRSYLTDIGDAIRERVGGARSYLPSEMGPAIRAFPEAMDTAILERELGGVYENRTATRIGKYALAYNEWLTGVSLAACLEFAYNAFESCPSLESVYAPACIVVGQTAFMSCSRLSEVSFPECRTIGYSAFASCTALSRACLPACTYVSSYAFAYCAALSEVSLPRCAAIASYAFSACSALGSISLPAVSAIAEYAFYRCSRLSQLWLMGPSRAQLDGRANALMYTPMSQSSYLGYFGSIYVPASLYDAYISAPNWSLYSSRFVSVEG